MQSYRQAALVLCLVGALAACGPRSLLLTAGTAAGVGGMQSRGLGGAISDYELKLAINEAWFQHSLRLYEDADFMISEGRVLLIGRVGDDITRLEAADLVKQAGAHEVVNRLTVGPEISVDKSLNDRLIGARLLGDITFDRDVAALNYDIEVVDGVVYLMGIARNEGEVRRVTYLAQQIDGVSKVESYMRVVAPTTLANSSEGIQG